MDFHPAGLIGLSWYTYRFHKFHKSRTDMGYLRGTPRSYNIGTSVSKYLGPLDYRIKKIERNVRQNAPELKSYQAQGTAVALANNFNFLGITQGIVQGDDEFNRNGNGISIKGIKITGTKNSSFLSCYLTLCPNGISPTAGVFTTSSVPQVLIAEGDDFKILKYIHNYSSTSQVLNYNRRFKKGLHTKYRALMGASESQNALYLCWYNPTATNYSMDYTLTVFFTDN